MSVGDYLAVLLKEPKKRRQPEYDEQVRFFAFVDVLGELNPDAASSLEDVWASSSGGLRHKGAAGRMRAAGQRRGVPDIECMVPNETHHGLFIEMKAGQGRTTTEQRDRLARLTQRGYATKVAWSWQDAGRVLCEYLALTWPPQAEGLVELRLQNQRDQRKAIRRQRQHARPAARMIAGHHPDSVIP